MASIKLYKPLLLGIMGMLCSILISPAVAQERKDKESIVPAQMFSPGDIGSYRKLFIWLAEGWLDPNQVLDADSNTTMHYLATNWQDLLRDAVRRGGACNRKNANGATPLHFAAAQGHAGPGLASILPLLRCGADPNLQDARGVTPVHAIYRSVKETNSIRPNRIEIELRGNTVNRSVKETAGIYTFGHVSTTNLDFDRECFPCQGGGRLDILRTLLAAGAKPNVKDNGGDTPLMLVVKYRGNLFTELSHVKTLLEHDADPNTRDKSGATPLIVVVGRGSNSTNWNDESTVPIIKALLKAGADPDLRDSEGDTPLIHAAKHEDDIVSEMEAILAGGADPCLRDRKGKVPWEYTDKGSGRWQLLSKAGGQVNRVTGICSRDLLEAEQQEKKLKLARGVRRRIQSCLKQQGHDPGTPDGLFGPRTRQAIRAWQIAQRETKAATGFLTQGQADELRTACKVAVSPLCTGQTGSSCWMEVSNQPGCYKWNPNPAPEETVTWSGSCRDGKVSGRGKVTWRYRKDGAWRTSSQEGEYRDGKGQDGHWVFHENDVAHEGSFVNNKKHGLWVKPGFGRGDWICFSNGEQYGESACLSYVDRTMQAKRRAQLRIGPGASYSEGGMLRADEKVQVTAEAGEWRWVKKEDGREGFVSASVLEELRRPKVVVKPQCIFAEDFVPWPKLQVLLKKYNYNLKREHLGIASDTSGYEEHEEDDEFTIAMYKRTGLRLERCWVKIDNVPNCYVFLGSLNELHFPAFIPQSIRRPRINWSGKCTDSVVSGEGTMGVNPWHGQRGFTEPNLKAFFAQGKRHEEIHDVYPGSERDRQGTRSVCYGRKARFVGIYRGHFGTVKKV